MEKLNIKPNQNKWNNKELLYSAIFLFAGITIFSLHLFSVMTDFIMLLPLSIKNILFNIGVFSILSTASWIVVCLFFLLCSVYLGILSIKKAQPNASYLAYLLVLVSSISFFGLIIVLLFFTNLSP